MELRHLRYFLAVAEELHFARAAEKLHIEQSPLSRAIKELEEELGVVLFARTTRSTRLTRAGKLFREHVIRVFAALQQARDSVKAAANGFHGQLRVALSDGITPSRLPALLALCHQEEPEVELRFFEVPLSQQIKGLHDDMYDVGFAQSDEVGDGIVATPAWSDTLMVAVPARHPLLAHKRIPLEELLRYPLVLCDPQVCEGHAKYVDRVLRRVDMEPLIAERVATCDLMMALVSAGLALGFTGAARIAANPDSGVVARPLALRMPPLTTYLLYPDGEPSDVLARFIERVQAIESPEPQGSSRAILPIPWRNLRHEEDHPVLAGGRVDCLRPVRNASESEHLGSEHPNGGRTGSQPRTAQRTAPAMQDGSPQAGRRAVQPGGRGHAQAVLWRRRNPIHAAKRTTQVLIVGGSPHRLHISDRHAAMRYRLRRFYLARCGTHSVFLLDVSA